MDENVSIRARLIPEDRRPYVEGVAEELTGLVFDVLGPVLQRYRTEAAFRLGLGLPELTCLEQLRRFGPQPSARIGDQTGLTRSSVSKMLRRLERDGHLTRRPDNRHSQGTLATLLPNVARDRVLDDLREQVRVAMLAAADELRLDHEPNIRAVVGALHAMLACFQDTATASRDQRWWDGAYTGRDRR